MANPNLSDYNIASALDCAPIRHRVMELPGAEVHGLGETAVPPVPPAIGNAVARLGYTPAGCRLTPERVLAASPAPQEGRHEDPLIVNDAASRWRPSRPRCSSTSCETGSA